MTSALAHDRRRTAAAPTGAPVRAHLRRLRSALMLAEEHAPRIEAWAIALAERLRAGGRLLVAGNGGSAAEAQHLTAELVGRYRRERPAFSAIALTVDTSSLTAIGNDYGFDEVFARQVRAHARAGDVVLLLSTSGRSPNLLSAARAARAVGATAWALTGPEPNALAAECDEAICLAGSPPHVQECQLAVVHALCDVFDERTGAAEPADARPGAEREDRPVPAPARPAAPVPAGAEARA